MASSVVQVAPDSTGKKIDTSELNVGANLVERQRVVLGDDADALGLAAILNAEPGSSIYGLVVRPVFPAPGDDETGIHGPLVQAVVSAARESFEPDTIRPLSLTTDGRLRVASSESYSDMNLFEFSLGSNPRTDPSTFECFSGNPWELNNG